MPNRKDFSKRQLNTAEKLLDGLHNTRPKQKTNKIKSFEAELVNIRNNAAQLLGIPAEFSQLLRRPEVLANEKHRSQLTALANTMLRDTKEFEARFRNLDAEVNRLRGSADEMVWIVEGLQCAESISTWMEQFQNVVLPVTASITEIVESIETEIESARESQ